MNHILNSFLSQIANRAGKLSNMSPPALRQILGTLKQDHSKRMQMSKSTLVRIILETEFRDVAQSGDLSGE